MERRILQVSLRADPLSAYRGGPIGGQQVQVDAAVRALQAEGFGSDVLTVSGGVTEGSALGHLGRVIRLAELGAVSDDELAQELPRLLELAREWMAGRRRRYLAVHTYSWYSGAVGGPLAAESGLPWVHSPGTLPDPGTVLGEPVALMVRQLTGADRVVVGSEEQARRVRGWAPEARTIVVRPAVDARTFFPRDAGPVLRRLNVPRRYLLMVAGAHADPSVDAVMAAWSQGVASRRIPEDCWLVALGPGLDVLADAALRIRAPGTVGRRAVPSYYGGAAVVLLPMQSTRGLPALEAMASGVPVVAYDAPAIRELVPDGETGVLVSASDPDALLEAAVGLWNDLPRAVAMGSRASLRIMESYTLDRLGQDLASVYQEAAGIAEGAAEA